MTIKFAVAGTGWVATEYAKAIQACPNAELHSVVSRDAGRAAAALEEWGVQARVYTEFGRMVADSDTDAVILCSTPETRADQAILAAQNGKHLVLEKPLALDRAGLDRMTEALERYPVTTSAGFVLRFNPAFETIKALVNDDAVGRIFMAQIDYWNHIGPQFNQFRWSAGSRLGGSGMLSAGCHAVDALRYFAGEIAEVTALSCRTWDDSSYEYDPNAIALFRLKNGGIGKVSAALECKTPYKFNIHLLGEKGTVLNNRIFSHKFPGQTDYATFPTVMPDNGDVALFPFEQLIEDFTEAVLKGTPTRCDFADARRTMDVCFAIDESIATGKTVVLE